MSLRTLILLVVVGCVGEAIAQRSYVTQPARVGARPTGTMQAGPKTKPTGTRTKPTGTRTKPTGSRTKPTGSRTKPTGTRPTHPTRPQYRPTIASLLKYISPNFNSLLQQANFHNFSRTGERNYTVFAPIGDALGTDAMNKIVSDGKSNGWNKTESFARYIEYHTVDHVVNLRNISNTPQSPLMVQVADGHQVGYYSVAAGSHGGPARRHVVMTNQAESVGVLYPYLCSNGVLYAINGTFYAPSPTFLEDEEEVILEVI